MFRQRLLASTLMLALAAPLAITAAQAQSTVQSMPYSTASVQRVLNDLGYSAGPVDGLMGGKTRNAIRAYQTDNGLPASGAPTAGACTSTCRTATPSAMRSRRRRPPARR
jgi:peptidoglycan hydrolase-like protein with peptidoglycan-binding domain